MKKILNILLGVMMAITVVLLVYALATGSSDETITPAISLNLLWGYVLLAGAVIAALGSAVYGMVKNPAGIKGTLISVALIVVVVGVAYFVAAGHSISIPNLADGGFFDRDITVLTDASILVTYAVMVIAFLTAVVTEVWGAFK